MITGRPAARRRSRVVIGAAVAATVLCAVNPGAAGARSIQPDPPDPPAAVGSLDGFRLGHLPAGLGPMVSDFAYEWDDVSFRTRTWERGPDAAGGYHVDLLVGVLRSARLTDPQALRDFLAVYLERDPQQWKLDDYNREPYRGFAEPGRVFFMVRPGVAVQVAADEGEVVSQDELIATADGIEPEH